MEESVLDLFFALRKQIIKTDENINSNFWETQSHNKLKKYRKNVFEILLNRSYIKVSDNSERNLSKEYLICQYNLHISRYYKEADKLRDLFSTINIEKYSNILRLLLLLQRKNDCNNVSYESEVMKFPENVEQNYTQFKNENFQLSKSIQSIILPQTFEWKGFKLSSQFSTGYFFTSEKFQSDLKENQFYSTKGLDYTNVFTLPIPKLPKTISKNDVSELKTKSKNNRSDISVDIQNKSLDEKFWENVMKEKIKFVRTWRKFKEVDFTLEKPFIHEAGPEYLNFIWYLKLKHMKNLYDKRASKVNQNKVILINITDFCNDVKNVLVGLQSRSFKYDFENTTFKLRNEVCIKGLTPASIHYYIQEIIQNANLYVKLLQMSNPKQNVQRNSYQSYIVKELCSQLHKWLLLYRYSITNLKNDSLLQNHKYISEQKHILEMLFNIYIVLPQSETNEYTLTGTEILTNMYKLINITTDKKKYYILIGILYKCYQAYFRCFLQPWLFEGQIIDPQKDFFIKQNTKYSNNKNRKYWSHSFVRATNVELPNNIAKYINEIIRCGKSVHFMKRCAPNSPLCYLLSELTQLQVCFTKNDLHKVKKHYYEFYEHSKKCFGEPFTIANLYREKELYALKLKETAEKHQLATLENLKLQKKEEDRKNTLIKKQKLSEQYQQMIEDLAKKEAKQIEDRKKNLVLFDQLKIHEQIEAARINDEKKKLLEYYQDLTEAVEIRKEHFENVSSQIKQDLIKTQNHLIESKQTILKEKVKENDVQINNNFPVENQCNLNTFSGNFNAVSPVNNNLLFSNLKLNSANVFNAHMKFQEKNESIDTLTNCNLVFTSSQNVDNTLDSFSLNGVENVVTPTNNNKINASIEICKSTSDITKTSVNVFNNNISSNTKTYMDNLSKQNSSNINYTLNLENNSTRTQSDRFCTKSKKTVLEENRYKLLYKSQLSFTSIKHPDINEKQITDKPLTALQKNRLKVMAHEFGVSINTNTNNSSTSSNLKKTLNSTKNTTKTQNSDLVDPKQKKTDNIDIVCTKTYKNDIDVNGISKRKNNLLTLNLKHDNENKSFQVMIPIDMSLSTAEAQTTNSNLETLNSETKETGFRFPKRIPYISFENINRDTSKENISIYNDDIIFYNPLFQMRSSSPRYNQLGHLIIPPYETNEQFYEPINYNDTVINEEHSTQIQFKSIFHDFMDNECHDHSVFKDLLFTSGEEIDYWICQSIEIPLKIVSKLVDESVMKFFLIEQNLLIHLESLSYYFFLIDGEFCNNMTCSLFSSLYEAENIADLLNYRTLNFLMLKALNLSSSLNSDKISFEIQTIPDVLDLNSVNILECLSLSYRVEWPLNLMLPNEIIEKYNRVFKYLLKIERVRWVLDDSFKSLKFTVKELGLNENTLNKSPEYKTIQFIRHTMLHWLLALQRHISDVIYTSYTNLRESLTKATNVDQLFDIHKNYINDIIFNCLLNQKSASVMKVIEEIFITIFKFHSYLKSQEWDLTDMFYTHLNYKKMENTFNNFKELVKFVIKIGNKLVRVGYQPNLELMLEIMNMNGYYDNIE